MYLRMVGRKKDRNTPEQRAQDWLSNIANKQDDVKELVMQQVLGAEGQDF